MCNPAFMAMGVQGTGAGLNAYGAIQAGKSQADYYSFLASQNNKQAIDVEKAGTADITGVQTQAELTTAQKARDEARVEGSQRAAAAANGVGGGSVTSQDIAKDTVNTATRDADAIRYNADIKSFEIGQNTKLQAGALRDQASQFGQAGINATKAGGLNAVSSLLNGATSVASNWYQWKQTSDGAKVPKLDDDSSTKILSSPYRPRSKLSLY